MSDNAWVPLGVEVLRGMQRRLKRASPLPWKTQEALRLPENQELVMHAAEDLGLLLGEVIWLRQMYNQVSALCKGEGWVLVGDGRTAAPEARVIVEGLISRLRSSLIELGESQAALVVARGEVERLRGQLAEERHRQLGVGGVVEAVEVDRRSHFGDGGGVGRTKGSSRVEASGAKRVVDALDLSVHRQLWGSEGEDEGGVDGNGDEPAFL